MRKASETIETLAGKTSFTVDELKTLSRGDLLPFISRRKLADLPEAVAVAHQEKRTSMVEALCNELRTGEFTKGEAARLSALLGLNNRTEVRAVSTIDLSSVTENLERLTESLNT